jgi:hypothetical protein
MVPALVLSLIRNVPKTPWSVTHGMIVISKRGSLILIYKTLTTRLSSTLVTTISNTSLEKFN